MPDRGPNHYDELKRTHAEVAADLESKPVPNWIDANDALTTANDQRLAAKVADKKLKPHEAVSQAQRFDNALVVKMNADDARAKLSPEASREPSSAAPTAVQSRFLSTGRGGMVSQQAIALENAKIANQDRGAPQERPALEKLHEHMGKTPTPSGDRSAREALQQNFKDAAREVTGRGSGDGPSSNSRGAQPESPGPDNDPSKTPTAARQRGPDRDI